MLKHLYVEIYVAKARLNTRQIKRLGLLTSAQVFFMSAVALQG